MNFDQRKVVAPFDESMVYAELFYKDSNQVVEYDLTKSKMPTRLKEDIRQFRLAGILDASLKKKMATVSLEQFGELYEEYRLGLMTM